MTPILYWLPYTEINSENSTWRKNTRTFKFPLNSILHKRISRTQNFGQATYCRQPVILKCRWRIVLKEMEVFFWTVYVFIIQFVFDKFYHNFFSLSRNSIFFLVEKSPMGQIFHQIRPHRSFLGFASIFTHISSVRLKSSFHLKS